MTAFVCCPPCWSVGSCFVVWQLAKAARPGTNGTLRPSADCLSHPLCPCRKRRESVNSSPCGLLRFRSLRSLQSGVAAVRVPSACPVNPTNAMHARDTRPLPPPAVSRIRVLLGLERGWQGSGAQPSIWCLVGCHEPVAHDSLSQCSHPESRQFTSHAVSRDPSFCHPWSNLTRDLVF